MVSGQNNPAPAAEGLPTAVSDARAKPSPRAGGRPAAAKKGFRPEVQGLRALAVLMVVAYHVWLGRVSGGVDIFLLISAFLMTLQFARKVERGEPLRLVRHWLHLFKRLLPAAVVVLVAVLAGTWAVLPPRRWPDVLQQAWASLLYFQNWVLADTSVDYYAVDHSGASPLQHFWSLSIQGQVFILWPLIFAAAALIQRLLKRTGLTSRYPAAEKWLSYRALLAAAFGLVFAFSLAFSVRETAANQAYAYFDTRARLWEFALGSLLALALPYLSFPRGLRVLMGWLGVAGMLSCGLILVVDQQFPGYVALWPTLSAALIIVAGQTGSPLGADRILSARPLVGMGNISYALYLWHWPVLVIFLVAAGQRGANVWQGLAIIGSSILLAFLTTKFVETPLRCWNWPEHHVWRAAVVLVACGALLAGPVALWQNRITAYDAAAAAQPASDNPGAAALEPGYAGTSSPSAKVIPAPAELKNEFATIEGDCTGRLVPASPVLAQICHANQPVGTPAKTIVVLGDSHSQQWLPDWDTIAAQRNWQIVMLIKSGCRYGADAPSRADDCNEFNDLDRGYVMSLKPDAVFTLASLTLEQAPFETEVPGYLDGIKGFTDAGIQVIGMRDNPRFTINMADCAATKGAAAPACNPPLSESLAATAPMDAYHDVPNFFALDLSDYICANGVCPAVVGNVYVYKDDNHLTKTYTQSMSAIFEQRLLAETGWH
ncbi:acyltransferase family protein [Paenarthrobacter sp. PH39-S1]|uniref:acyltransferase family protein n=1 Tax=Paenarthrobacter sp. PH39-S1 TaxID=3046204 RepID=UPI0024B9CB0E|nr:acyltransferase family protein [Paenarthrobacter sp. PH39-S1]MDJ0358079.1 acyltransferase family protein [Paenarthrobacter sp. PH39-S1]